jgi:hypothetical protein
MSRRLRRVGSLIALPVLALSLAACGGELPGMAAGPPSADSTLPTPAEMLREHCRPKTVDPALKAYEDRVDRAGKAYKGAEARVNRAVMNSDLKALMAAVKRFDEVNLAVIRAIDRKHPGKSSRSKEFADVRAGAVLAHRAMKRLEHEIAQKDGSHDRVAKRLAKQADDAFARSERDVKDAALIPECPQP